MRRFASTIFLLAASWLAGCRAPTPTRTQLDFRPDFYPIGLYCVDDTNDFATVHGAGFNAVRGPANKGFLDAAQANGLNVLASLDTVPGTNFDPAKAGAAVKQFDAHPALWAWYLVDEPDYNRISPDDVRRAEAAVKSFSPAKPTALVLYDGHSARDYAGIADITMIDRYPVPWLPLANFGQHVGLVRAAVPPDKPLLAVIQAFDWSTDSKDLPGVTNVLRPPTYAEMRCMTYEALAHGANGLFYFAFDTGPWKIRDHPETWEGLMRVVAEVNDRLPLFRAERIWWPGSLWFADPSRQFNAALESSVTLCLLRVRDGDSQWPAGDYLLAVNSTDQPQLCSFTLPPGRTSPVTAVGEDRSLSAPQGWLTDAFAPYGVHVYGPLK